MKYQTLPWIAGNPLRLQIPLQKVTITADGHETEDYAYDCQNVTDSHKAAINALESVDDVEDYNFRQDYPEKLSFGK